MKYRNAFCSFCRKSYRDVGPLVEGPGDVYICGECIELCQSIIDQEKRRRNPGRTSAIGPETVRATLDGVVSGQEEAKAALALWASLRDEGTGPALLLGPGRSSKLLLTRALAHALDVPFAAGDARGLVPNPSGSGVVLPLLYELLSASHFDLGAAQRGVVYVGGVEGQEAQEGLLRLWEGNAVEVVRGKPGEVVSGLHLDVRRILFVCGGTFPRLDAAVARLGRQEEQPVSSEALVADGVRPDFAARLRAIARVDPLDDASVAHLIAGVDFRRLGGDPSR
jgi:ATP-dependent Clp protease ATP-binding subunit ClpX